ncbi:hypothetical protein [Nocardioides mangrovi]|uniref:ABC transporter permease n=1 Tax=Nocardioides mangrovi TaxID=2874580 RepID=A0ABS7UH27_9ACTN|nr:hypothetical protein [Nocardioides mangrovi]MBZ5740343.1 hypothetical protein [Nocardioides mangrovi]
MIRLLGVELTRLRWRRAVVALLVLAIVVPALIAASRIWATRPVSQDELDTVARQNAGQIAQCVKHPNRYGVRGPDAMAEQRCTDTIVGWYTGRERMSFLSERLGGSGMGVVAVLTALLLLAATTFVGHDWNSGSMSNQLLFEPRRGRIWAAKAIAVTLVAGVLAVIVSTAYWLGIWATISVRDLPTAPGALGDSLAYGLRGAGYATAATLGGYALTMLFRSTVATIGVLFGVVVAGGIVIAALSLGEQWQPQKNVSAIVKNGTMYYVDLPEACGGPQVAPDVDCNGLKELPLWRGAAYYGVPLLIVGAGSVLSFRRRDVP